MNRGQKVGKSGSPEESGIQDSDLPDFRTFGLPDSPSAGCSWSGGKDSCYALMEAVQQGVVPKVLLNMMNENGKISRSHGLPSKLLQQQAAAMELPIITVASSWKDYEKILRMCYRF